MDINGRIKICCRRASILLLFQDLIPDFIPVFGILDDLLLLPGFIWLAIRLIPEIVWQRALERADSEPLLLGHNWAAAAAIFTLWDALLLFLVYVTIGHFGSPYWRQHWWVWVAVVGALLVAVEGGWSVLQLRAEKRAAHVQQDCNSATASLLADEAETGIA